MSGRADFTVVRIVSGWTLPLDFELLDDDDDPIDLSDVDSVQLQLFEESGAVFSYSGTVGVQDAIAGLVRFTPAAGDLRAGVSRRVLAARWKVQTGSEVYFVPSGEKPDQWIIARPTLAAVAVAAPPMDPVTGDVRIYAGDDYDPDDAFRALEWSSDSWPNLTGAGLLTLTVRNSETDGQAFTLTNQGGDPELGVVGAGSAEQRVRVLRLPKAKTVLLAEYGRNYKADVSGVLANGDVVALVDARVIAAEKQTRA